MKPQSPMLVSPEDASSEKSIKSVLPWLVAVAFFMEALDTTILNTAVPAIAEGMSVSPLGMKAVLSSYTLSLAVFIPLSGWMADRFGTRRLFAAAIAVFTLGSFLSGISENIHVLVASRILQGCGGAMMMPVGRLTMVRTFDKSELIRAMSFVVIPGLIGPMLGPTIGGLIVQYFHWRMIFFVNIPIGLIGLVFVLKYLPDYRSDHSRPLDLIGLILFGIGVSLLSYVLEVFGEHTMAKEPIIVMLLVSFVMIGAYLFRSQRIDYPLLNLQLFKIRTFNAAVIGSFITRLGMGGMPFLLPLLYQVGLGFSPVESGFFMIPQPLAAMCFKLTYPSILKRFGYRKVLISNTIGLGLWIMLFTLVNASTPIWFIIMLSFCYGFLTSLQFTSMNTLVYADLSGDQTSQASTISSAMQQMSISFGIAVASLTTSFFIADRFHSNSQEMVHGLHSAFLILGGLTIISSLIFRPLKPEDGSEVSQNHQ